MLINYTLIIKFHPQNSSLPPSIAVLEYTLLLQWRLFLPLYNIQYICTSFSSTLHNSYMTWIALASWKRQREVYSLLSVYIILMLILLIPSTNKSMYMNYEHAGCALMTKCADNISPLLSDTSIRVV